MNSLPFQKSLTFFLFILAQIGCAPLEVALHGDISGSVMDAETQEAVSNVDIELKQNNQLVDTTTTSQEGLYLIRSLRPGIYEVGVSKIPFENETTFAQVVAGSTTDVSFALVKGAFPRFSAGYLDFGFEATEALFTISNTGAGTLTYAVSTSQDWIIVQPRSGEVSSETDTIRVTLDRPGLSSEKIEESIFILSTAGNKNFQDQVEVFANGLVDQDGHYYSIVTIGTQTWMAENLNRGTMLRNIPGTLPADNGIVEKYCYDDLEVNCNFYGGLYSWVEAMDYHPSDTGLIGTTRGICPDGWHMPTQKEYETLVDYLGGWLVAGGKLKDTTSLWLPPNQAASNESGFSAIPGGTLYPVSTGSTTLEFSTLGEQGIYYLATLGPPNSFQLSHTSAGTGNLWGPPETAMGSVRCIEDP